MKTTEIMTSDPFCCVPEDDVIGVAKQMEVLDVGSIPVVRGTNDLTLVGIVTDRDIALKVVGEERDPSRCQVGMIMSTDVVTSRPDEELDAVLAAMSRHQVRRIPVVDSQHKVVGIVAQADLARRSLEPEKTAEVLEEISRPNAATREIFRKERVWQNSPNKVE